MKRFPLTSEQSARLRERIAREAARLIVRGKVQNFHTARSRAARWLSQSKLSSAEMPTQEEIAREIEALSRTTDWDQLTRIDALCQDVLDWLGACEPLLQYDWQQANDLQGVVMQWLVSRAQLANLEQRLQEQKLPFERSLRAGGAFRFDYFAVVPHVIWVIPEADFSAALQQVESEGLCELLLGDERYHFSRAPLRESTDYEELGDEAAETDWQTLFRPLLKALEAISFQHPDHPEDNVLDHTRQVFALGRELHPWDEEFLWACLLHDIGMVVDRSDPLAAGLRLLEGRVSERVLFLITELPDAQNVYRGAIPRRSLRKSESFAELLDLAWCDREGRVPGRDVPELDECLEYLARLETAWDE